MRSTSTPLFQCNQPPKGVRVFIKHHWVKHLHPIQYVTPLNTLGCYTYTPSLSTTYTLKVAANQLNDITYIVVHS